jgi:hypothetical protein
LITCAGLASVWRQNDQIPRYLSRLG